MDQIKDASFAGLLADLDQAGHICRQQDGPVQIMVGHGQHQPRAGIRILVESNLLNVSIKDREGVSFNRYVKGLEQLLAMLVKTGHAIETAYITITVYDRDLLVEKGTLKLKIFSEGLRVSAESTDDSLIADLVGHGVSVFDLRKQDNTQSGYR